jgi:hypothetical protein
MRATPLRCVHRVFAEGRTYDLSAGSQPAFTEGG